VSAELKAEASAHGLFFLALLSFLGAFFGARIFTTISPDVVVVSSGIHFHHFWYGLIMIASSGWLGIASWRPELDRVYAITFGLGLGLVGDEVGLLLTFGDYRSELTYEVFVAGLALALLGFLFFNYRQKIEADVISLGRGERTVHFGIFIVALSALFFSFGFLTFGVAVLAPGLLMIAVGYFWHKRKTSSGA